MTPPDGIRLRHLIEAPEKAVGSAAQRTRQDLDSDELFRLALTKIVEIVGEAAKQVSQDTRDEHPDVLCSTVTDDLPSLLEPVPRPAEPEAQGPAAATRTPRSSLVTRQRP